MVSDLMRSKGATAISDIIINYDKFRSFRVEG
jgi:hypothetical protein